MPKIYESPDGGKTIYSREIGATDRILEKSDFDEDYFTNEYSLEILKEHKLWRQILVAARSDPSLQEAVDRVKIIYHLSNKHGKE